MEVDGVLRLTKRTSDSQFLQALKALGGPSKNTAQFAFRVDNCKCTFAKLHNLLVELEEQLAMPDWCKVSSRMQHLYCIRGC